jgi:uncharacterized iron-regulated protein
MSNRSLKAIARLAGLASGFGAVSASYALTDSVKATAPAARPALQLNAAIGADKSAPHFRVFRKDGTTASLDDVVAAFDGAEVVLMGEAHDDPVAHQLELYMLIRADQRSRDGGGTRRVVLSLEQFERDAQLALDEYTAGLIREQDMLMDARPWGNYAVDYRALVEYSKAAQLRVVAANVPRRYVSAAGTKGLGFLATDLDARGKALLPPLPLPSVSADYRAHFEWAHGTPAATVAEGGAAPAAEGGGCPYIGLNAQQDTLLDPIMLWDSGMAHAIRAESRGAETLVLHVCGSFHSEFKLGIVEFLEHYGQDRSKVLSVTIYPEEKLEFDPVRHTNAGDWVILTDAALPRSHKTRH